ncbi:hypothetical protein AADZ86_18675 [Colwelliaceae bacterium BS250]
MHLNNCLRLLTVSFNLGHFFKVFLVISILSLTGCDHDDDDKDEIQDTNITANAGVDQQITPQVIVTLPGSGLTDTGTISSYAWTQTSGDTVTLLNSDNATASFTSPSNLIDNVLTFELTVTDSESNFATDTVDITVQVEDGGGTTPPTAVAGSDKIAMYGDVVNLFGLGTDSDGSIVSYQWQQVSGTAVSLINPTFPTTKFTVPDIDPTDLVFELTITDNDGLTATDIVTVSIQAEVVQPPLDGAALFESDCGGCHMGNSLGSGTSGPDLTSYTFEQLTARQDMVGHLTDPEVQAIADALVAEEIDGSALFESDCGGCHMGNGLGSGTSGPDLTSYTFEQLTARPDMVGHLTDPEVQAIADALIPEIIDGVQVFTDTCGGCHTANGLGSGSSDKTNRNVEQIVNASMTQGLSDLELAAVEEAITSQPLLFDDNCSGCHSRADKANRSAAEIANAIATVGSMMTASLEILNDRQLGVIADELLDGADLFSNTCGGCHTANGLGSGSSDKTNRNIEQIKNASMTQGLTDIQLQAVEEAITSQPLLFDDNCSGCHSRADKANRSAAEIASAIATVGSMMTASLEILNDRQLGVISNELIDGAVLFTVNCSGCHSKAEKANATAEDISGAIAGDLGGMGQFADFNDAQIQAIADALLSTP